MTSQLTPRQFPAHLRRPPIDVFAPMQRELGKVLEELGAGWSAISNLEHAPRMDVAETKDAVELSIELPGVALENVRIDVDDNVLIISGEKRAEKEFKANACRLSERAYGAFAREFVLPRGVDVQRIRATMADGVLTVTAPKDGCTSVKTIEIKVGG